VEADAERVGDLAGALEQFLGFAQGDAELRREAELRHFRGDAQPHAQRQIGRAFGCGDDLLEFLDRIEREGAHAIVEISLGDRFLGLDRVHEAQGRVGQHVADQAHLGDRRDVEMGDAIIPQDLD
jgi:hypothetical protein